MAFWNRKKKKDRQQEMLEKEAQEKLEEIRQKKIFQRKKKQEAVGRSKSRYDRKAGGSQTGRSRAATG